MRPQVLDLFSGIGGFSLAFERQGFSTIAQVEKDKNCLKLLESKWPTVTRHNDVTTFDTDSIECPSVVTFGSPCQDLSVAGQRQGMAGERSGLFYAATRIIQRLVGRGLEFALWENVEGAFSSNGGRDFAGVLAELGRCGALDIGWRVLDCQFWGLAQRRRRVFLVADFRGRRCPEVLSFESCLRGHPEAGREKGERVAGTIGSCAQGGFRSTDLDQSGAFIPCVARTVTAERDGYNDGSDQTYICMAHGQGNAEVRRDGEPSLTCNNEAPIVIPIQGVNGSGKAQNGLGVGANGSEMFTLTSRDQHAIAFSTKDHGQDAAMELSPTLRSGNHIDGNANGGCGPAIAFQSRIARNGHGVPSCAVSALQAAATGDSKPLIAGAAYGVRRLTPRECERLQGFPDDYTAGFSDSVRYRMLGNSVAVPVVEWLAKAMRAVIP